MAPPGNFLFVHFKLSWNSIFQKCSDRCVARVLCALISGFVLFMILYLLQPFQTITNILVIDTKGPAVTIIPDNFLSVALDSSVIANGLLHELNLTLLLILMKPLKGSYLRIGGTMADRLRFINDDFIYKAKFERPIDGGSCSYENVVCNPLDRPNFTMSGSEWLTLNKLAKYSGLTILFDLNVLMRNPDGSWNSSNAEELISFSNASQLDVIWELGNEPNSFKHVFNCPINATQLRADFVQLRNILGEYSSYKHSLLVGPDITRPLHTELILKDSEKYLEDFLSHSGSKLVDAITWHQYYFNGREALVQYYISPDVFDLLEIQIYKIKDIVNNCGYGNTPVWLGETSDAYGGGAPGLSDAYVSTFIWLDKLGLSAKLGIKVVIRQSLFKGDYALISNNYMPTPNWWISVMFKKFVGGKVVPCYYASGREVRLYCHCARKEAVYGHMPAIISNAIRQVDRDSDVYGMNMKQPDAVIRLQFLDNLEGIDQMIFAYVLETHVSILSSLIYLNDVILQLDKEGRLPEFKPRFIRGNVITIPGYSLGFWVIPSNDFELCK